MLMLLYLVDTLRIYYYNCYIYPHCELSINSHICRLLRTSAILHDINTNEHTRTYSREFVKTHFSISYQGRSQGGVQGVTRNPPFKLMIFIEVCQ